MQYILNMHLLTMLSIALSFEAFISYRNLFRPRALLQRNVVLTKIFYVPSKLSKDHGISPIFSKDIDIYENEEFLSEDDDDSEIEDAMALETFLELSFNTGSLSEQAFLDWEDIQEVFARGFVDRETIMIIMKEVGVKGGFMNFVQFKDVVELVNQVNAALEQNSLNDEDDKEIFDNVLTDDEGAAISDSEDDSTAKWIEAQLNKIDRS